MHILQAFLSIKVYSNFGKDSMTAVQLRNSLVEKINSIDISQIRQQVFKLNNSQKKSIQISREEIRKGKFISHEDVIKKQAKWLKK